MIKEREVLECSFRPQINLRKMESPKKVIVPVTEEEEDENKNEKVYERLYKLS